MRAVIFWCLLAAFGGAGPAPARASVQVTLSEVDQNRLGVVAKPLAASRRPETVPVFVRVLDVGPLAAIDADRVAASAAALASTKSLERLRRLAAEDDSASRQSVEAAVAQSENDNARLALLERRPGLEWGPAIGAMTISEREALIDWISRGQAALLRADAPTHPVGLLGQLAIVPVPGGPEVLARPLGYALEVDPRFQSVGLLAVIRGGAAQTLRPGRVLAGEVRTADSVAGVLLPRAAVVRLDGADWAYVRKERDIFERRRIENPRVGTDTWFVVSGFAPGELLVGEGAGVLVAVERADESIEEE